MTVAKSIPSPTPATYQDIIDLPEHLVGEIVDGELIVSPRPTPRHARASSVAGMDLGSPFDRKPGDPRGPGGWWIYDEPELHFGKRILVPDLAGWRRERMPSRPETAWFELPPDWVCEVVSPGTVRHDRVKKARIYLEEGVEWFWLVNPTEQSVEVLHNENGRWVLIDNWVGDDAEAKIPPFDAVALDLGRWWEG